MTLNHREAPAGRSALAKSLQARPAATPATPTMAQTSSRVLAARGAPAQLSLFLRPANAR